MTAWHKVEPRPEPVPYETYLIMLLVGGIFTGYTNAGGEWYIRQYVGGDRSVTKDLPVVAWAEIPPGANL